MRTAAVAACALALLVGACGRGDKPAAAGEGTSTQAGEASSSAPVDQPVTTAPPTAAPTTASSTTGTDRCHTAQLSGRIQSQGVGAGNVYVALVLTNNGTKSCRIYGYGGLQLLDAAHRPIPTAQSRNPDHPPVSVIVPPRGIAASLLHWGQVPTGDESDTGPCEPRPSFLAVIPPDETEPLLVPWLGGSVCKHGAIDQWAYGPTLPKPA